MYAIQNIKTKKFVYGTDSRYFPRRQRTSRKQMITYASAWQAQVDYKARHCGKDYRIVLLKEVEVEQVTDLHNKEPNWKYE